MLAPLLLLLTALPPDPRVCASRPEFVHKDSGPRFKEFKAWLLSQRESDAGRGVEQLERLLERPERVDGVTIVDANNDGADEYVVTRIEGSGGYLSMDVFAKQADGFGLLPDAPPPPEDETGEGDGSRAAAFDHEFTTSFVDGSALFMRLCGKTYLNFSEGLGTLSSYVWDGGRTRRACDTPLVAWARSLARRSLERNQIDDLGKFLTHLLERCDGAMTAEQRAGTRVELAQVHARLGNPDRCLEDLRFAAADVSGLHDAALERTIAAQQKRCHEQRARPAKPDLSALFEIEKPGRAGSRAPPSLDVALNAIVPEVPGKPDLLRDHIRLNSTMPAARTMREGRYATVASCRAHSCGDRAMLWADQKSSMGLFAINDANQLRPPIGPCPMLVGSAMLGPAEIPAAFWSDFARWRKSLAEAFEPSTHECIDFVGRDGKRVPLDPKTAGEQR